jgi:DNA invertase Pin-like site-specific DNA recombinase
VIPKRLYVLRARRAGVKMGRPLALTLDEARQMVDMRTQGKSVNEIAASFGVKRSTVHNYLRRAKAAAEQNLTGEVHGGEVRT